MVSIDTVYQRVLALANKEQRGYITPQEFNLFANQAQMDIFEQYFYDLNQFRRLPGNDTLYADMVDILEDKISIFKYGPTTLSASGIGISAIPGSTGYEVHRVTDLNFGGKILEEIRYEDYYKLQTPLTKPSTSRPVFWKKDGKIYWTPNSGAVGAHWIRKPVKVNWSSYTLSGSELYDSTNSVDFELHPSEETKLVIKILGLAGITLKDPTLYQIAGAEDNKNIQQEKQ
jgi:hypothetical protein